MLRYAAASFQCPAGSADQPSRLSASAPQRSRSVCAQGGFAPQAVPSPCPKGYRLPMVTDKRYYAPHARTHARMHAWGAYSESLVTIGNHGNRRGQSCASRRTFVDLPLSFRLNDGSPNVTVISLPNARSPRIRTSGSAPSTFSYRS